MNQNTEDYFFYSSRHAPRCTFIQHRVVTTTEKGGKLSDTAMKIEKFLWILCENRRKLSKNHYGKKFEVVKGAFLPRTPSCSRHNVKINTGQPCVSCCWYFLAFLVRSLALHQHKIFPFHHQMKSRWKLYHKNEKKKLNVCKDYGDRLCESGFCSPLCLCFPRRHRTLSLMLIGKTRSYSKTKLQNAVDDLLQNVAESGNQTSLQENWIWVF